MCNLLKIRKKRYAISVNRGKQVVFPTPREGCRFLSSYGLVGTTCRGVFIDPTRTEVFFVPSGAELCMPILIFNMLYNTTVSFPEVRGRDAQLLTVFGHSTTGHAVALFFQEQDDIVVGKRVPQVFLLDGKGHGVFDGLDGNRMPIGCA